MVLFIVFIVYLLKEVRSVIKVRKGCFETNSSSTHALILNNEDYYKDVSSSDLVVLLNLPQLETEIHIFTGEANDKTFEGKSYSTYEGCFTNIIDKLRYLYTCMCQDGLYKRDENNKINLNTGSNAYSIFKLIVDYLPNLKFIPPENGYCYVFEDCEWVIDELIETGIFNDLRTLGLFLLKGRIAYCNRDDDMELSDELHDIVKQNNKGSIVTGG